MGKSLRLLCIILCALCLTFGITGIIFAKSNDSAIREISSVNPYMAVISAVLMAVAGIIIFIKRNKSDKY